MSRKDLKEFRKMNPLEMREQINKLKTSFYHDRLQVKLGQMKDNSTLSRARKDIARLLTLLNQKEKSA